MKAIIKYSTLILINIFGYNTAKAQLYDNTFNGNGVWSRQVRNAGNSLETISIQPNGNILYSGSTADASSTTAHFAIGRINTNGTNDNSFDTDGIAEYVFTTDGYDNAYNTIYLNGKIYAAASNVNSSIANNLLVKLNDDGSLDNTFNSTGKLSPVIESASNSSYVVVKTNDSKIIVLGGSATTSPTFHLSAFKVDENASYVNTFGTNGKSILNLLDASFSANQVKILSNNAILMIAGKDLIKIKSNGHLDSTFGTNGLIDLSSISSNNMQGIAVQKDGKIVLCNEDANLHFSVYRLNANGTIDASFGTNGKVLVPFGGISSSATTVAVDTASVTGKIFVAGSSAYNSGVTAYMSLARISSTDGSIEAQAEFQPNNLNATAKNILLQSDGKIIIGGNSVGYSIQDFIVTRIVPNFTTLVAGIEESISITKGLNLFPNPASQTINIHSVYTIEHIKIIDILGNEVMSLISSGNTQLDISSLPKGLYNFVITTDKGTGNKKVSVQ